MSNICRFNEKRSRYYEKICRFNEKRSPYYEKICRFNEKRSCFNEKRSRYNDIIEWKNIMCGQYYVTVILHLKYSKIITFSMRTGQTKF